MSDQNIERIEAKLDQVLSILHGDGKQEMGMVQRVNILWTVVLKWPLYIISVIVGALLTILIQYLGGRA